MIILANFQNRTWTAATADVSGTWAPKQVCPFSAHDEMVTKLQARFGDKQPEHGVERTTAIRGMAFDSYAWGSADSAVWRVRSDRFNKPMPFPQSLRSIEAAFKRNSGRVMRLGVNSDPFMWMDLKYGHTKRVLTLAKQYDVQLVIHTMSDLAAHDEYIELIKAGKHTVVMQMGITEFAGDERIHRLVEPGAPSLKRRQGAITKLKQIGIDVSTTSISIHSFTKDQLKQFGIKTGTDTSNLDRLIKGLKAVRYI